MNGNEIDYFSKLMGQYGISQQPQQPGQTSWMDFTNDMAGMGQVPQFGATSINPSPANYSLMTPMNNVGSMGNMGSQFNLTPEGGYNIGGADFNPGDLNFTGGDKKPKGLWDKMGGMEGVSTGLNALTSAYTAYLGKQALEQSKDQFKFQKEAWNKNWDAQRGSYNRGIKGNYAENLSMRANPNDYQSLDSYMKENSIK